MIINWKKLSVCAVTLLMLSASVHADNGARDREFRAAADLYRSGMYAEARERFLELAGTGNAVAAGYAVMCSEKMQATGYEDEIARYEEMYPYSGMLPQIYLIHGLNLFDEGDYAGASDRFYLVPEKRVSKGDRAEFHFKNGWCFYVNHLYNEALDCFAKVENLPHSDYVAPAAYATGVIYYESKNFNKAIECFDRSVKDPRFEEMSKYYVTECRFLLKDYDYVIREGGELYKSVSEERKGHLARIISESYLVKGDVASAKSFYDTMDKADVRAKTRSDWFYEGSLLYATMDYEGAAKSFSMMSNRTDSLGQIANYQLGYSLVQTRNKVAAMQAFKDAAAFSFDKDIQEDADFNYSKLAFDLNNDVSAFNTYISKYSDRKKGDKIYAYIAMAALQNHDYASAVEAYDKIEVLDENMKGNYMKANFLRGRQLVSGGSYRNAVPCLRASAYFTDRHTPFNQLARYWLAESYYRDEQYSQARSVFNELYNLSALDGKNEGSLIPYDIAYCYFKTEDYDMAAKWFDLYVEDTRAVNRRDAMVRRADCSFLMKDYAAAAKAYDAVTTLYIDNVDLYPNYQAGISYGLVNNPQAKIDRLSVARTASPDAAFFDEAMYELGRSYMAADKGDDAAQCYKSLVKNSKDSTYIARGLIGLGMISRNASRYDEALGYYRKVVEDLPESGYAKDALLAVESIYQRQGTPEKYVEFVENLGKSSVTSDIDPQVLMFNSAEQIFLSGNYEKALTSLQTYQTRYPGGRFANQTDFYMAESYRNLGMKDRACDCYKKVIASGDSSFAEFSALNYASLSYGMERFTDAYDGYKTLGEIARMESNIHVASLGMMRSAFGGKNWSEAIARAAKVTGDKASDEAELREAQYVTAKSLLATSRRDEAFEILGKLASKTSTPEGAEATYLLIQDLFDKGEFKKVEDKVFDFSDSNTSQTYWLAKAFIVLGDSYAEREDFVQAKATFESVRDGYKPFGDTDDVLDNVSMRLKKIEEMGK